MSWGDVSELLCGLGLLLGGLAYLSTVLRVTWQPWIVLATFARFAMTAGLGTAFVLGLLAHNWLVVAVAAAVWAARAADHVSRGVPAQDGAELTVLTANLLIGRANAVDLVRTVAEHQVDVLFAQELTPAARRALIAAGIGERLPHSFLEAREGGGGTGIWSRFPLAEQSSHHGFWFAVLSARLRLPEGSPLVCAAHLSPPWPYPSALWARELPLLGRLLAEQPRLGGVADAIILGGDLNATLDHPQFRKLVRGEVRDAAAQAGRRRLRTWPADRLRPVFGIDHILLKSATAREVRTVPLTGSDHLGVLATVRLPSGK